MGLTLSVGWLCSPDTLNSLRVLGKSGVPDGGQGEDWSPPAGVWVLQTHGGRTTPQGLNGSKTWADTDGRRAPLWAYLQGSAC